MVCNVYIVHQCLYFNNIVPCIVVPFVTITECPWGSQTLRNPKWVSQTSKVFLISETKLCTWLWDSNSNIWNCWIWSTVWASESNSNGLFRDLKSYFFLNWQVDLLYMNKYYIKCFTYHLLTNYNQMFFRRESILPPFLWLRQHGHSWLWHYQDSNPWFSECWMCTVSCCTTWEPELSDILINVTCN